MKKKDVILLVSVVAFSLLLLLVMKVTGGNSGDTVIIRQNGGVYGTYSLEEDQVIEIAHGDDYNKICILHGEVYMESANCPDGYCVEQNKISRENQTIVCLPHKLVVEIEITGEKEAIENPDDGAGAIDAVAK